MTNVSEFIVKIVKIRNWLNYDTQTKGEKETKVNKGNTSSLNRVGITGCFRRKVMTNHKPKEKIKHPAICVVHTPSGPVPCCGEHAKQIETLARFMDWHVNRTLLTEDAECSNCVNETKL